MTVTNLSTFVELIGT